LKSSNQKFAILFIILFSYSCAQVVAPSGGEKDITPPTIMDAQPPIGQLNFNEHSFTLEFDEFIKLKSLNKQLLISPPLKYDLDARVKGKSLKAEFDDTLKENTTYVINFGSAIVDITEQNPLVDFKYVFSTGKTIDSLSLSGHVMDAFELKRQEEFNVQLYRNSTFDSLPMNSLPDYVAKTDKEGNFSITNIRPGNYVLFALKDGNSNYLFDRPDEEIAFVSNALQLDSSTSEIKLYSFAEDNQNQFVEKVTVSGPLVTIKLKKAWETSIEYAIVEKENQPELIHSKMNVRSDSLLFWWTQSIDQEYNLELNIDGEIKDTVSFKLDSITAKRKLKLAKKIKERYAYYQPLRFEFERPLSSISQDLIELKRLDGKVISFEASIDSINAQRMILTFKQKEDSTYRVNLLPGAINDIYGRSNDTINNDFTFDNAEDYGTLIVNIDPSVEGHRILQLTNANGKVLRNNYEETNTTSFRNLKAGQYGLKIIFDKNQNKKWDTGKFADQLQAESCIILEEKIDIRANWDKEIDWVITQDKTNEQ